MTKNQEVVQAILIQVNTTKQENHRLEEKWDNVEKTSEFPNFNGQEDLQAPLVEDPKLVTTSCNINKQNIKENMYNI